MYKPKDDPNVMFDTTMLPKLSDPVAADTVGARAGENLGGPLHTSVIFVEVTAPVKLPT